MYIFCLLKIVQKSTNVELCLIKSEIEEIEKIVEVGIQKLSWTSDSKIHIPNIISSISIYESILIRYTGVFE